MYEYPYFDLRLQSQYSLVMFHYGPHFFPNAFPGAITTLFSQHCASSSRKLYSLEHRYTVTCEDSGNGSGRSSCTVAEANHKASNTTCLIH